MNRIQLNTLIKEIDTKNSWGKNQLKEVVDRIVKDKKLKETELNYNHMGLVTNLDFYETLFLDNKTTFGKEKLKIIILNIILELKA